MEQYLMQNQYKNCAFLHMRILFLNPVLYLQPQVRYSTHWQTLANFFIGIPHHMHIVI